MKTTQRYQFKFAVAILSAAFAMTATGCKHDTVSDYQKPVNADDPTGMGLTKSKRAEMINGDPTMTPDQRAAALQRLQSGRHVMGAQAGHP
jgi:hypothetical protein